MITIYGRPNCGYCTKAKQLAETANIAFEYRDVFEDDNMTLMMEAAPGSKTVPQIVQGTRLIGGYEDFYREYLSGAFN